jgi:hypothetical protein
MPSYLLDPLEDFASFAALSDGLTGFFASSLWGLAPLVMIAPMQLSYYNTPWNNSLRDIPCWNLAFVYLSCKL